MIETTQRWRDRRDSYRHRGEAFDPGQYGVEPIATDREARAFVVQHHYSGSYPAARLRVGLYRRRAWFAPELVGVAVVSVPMQPAVIPCYTGLPVDEGAELGRFVLLDDVPFNGETWFLRRVFGALRQELPKVRALVSYSDPERRVTVDGRVVIPGHVGTIYQAKGARYVGRSKAETNLLDGDGRVFPRRSLRKIAREERGGEGATRRLLALGAPVRRVGEAPAAWLSRVLASGVLRACRHPGNHVYLFDATGGALRLPEGARAAVPYPKAAA